MKSYQKIATVIVFMLVTISCLVVVFHTNYLFVSPNMEMTSEGGCADNGINADLDHFDDDQILHYFDSETIAEIITRIPALDNCFWAHKITSSIWQPPRLS